ncbi:MAG: flagellar hook-length control protein FliK [Thiohalomonadaceae bacterium]
MSPTQAAASALDLLRPESKTASPNSKGSPGGFSQELENQVKNANGKNPVSKQESVSGRPAGQVNSNSSKPSEKADADQSDAATAAESGKALPPTAEVDPIGTAVLQILRAEQELPAEPVLAILPMVPQLAQDTPLMTLDEADEDTGLLRDLLPQRFAGKAEKGAVISINQQNRADFSLDLAAQTVASRPAAGTDGLGSLAAVSTASNNASQPAAALPAQMSLGHPVQQKGWDQAMGQRVVWMVRNNMQEAQIQLNPRELGPINVRVSVSNDQASVHFIAQHATTREALDAAMPRLREMLAESGLNLAQSDVSQQSPQQRGEGSGHGGAAHRAADTLSDEERVIAEQLTQVSYVSPSGVDYFI